MTAIAVVVSAEAVWMLWQVVPMVWLELPMPMALAAELAYVILILLARLAAGAGLLLGFAWARPVLAAALLAATVYLLKAGFQVELSYWVPDLTHTMTLLVPVMMKGLFYLVLVVLLYMPRASAYLARQRSARSA
ncbi:hypothetical protein RAS12_04530 [Achromobacter seleniivolatilans]|uniref:Transmembrane protein n=1 Tax=Achromobacter seleniivolatilans TaxID=3047478 RepID=A0ABY9M4U2_9BURK|nr:hypothetical protein [Achromobacter sp. R39]WMD21648.1 hypothetical protein RAS12_04530 [Achromobacter sp. R39]